MRTMVWAAWFAANVASAAPITVPHSGRVLGADGSPVDGTYPVTVTLHDAASGGNTLFTQTFSDVVVQDGYFTVLLTTSSSPAGPLDGSLFAGGPRWVASTVGPASTGRQPIGAVPVAGVAGQVPSSTTRPAGCAAGAMMWDSDEAPNGALLVCDGQGAWLTVAGGFSASGGAITTTATHKIHTFTASGAFTVSTGTRSVEVLVVGGGGGGGKYWSAGGGGGGGVVYNAAFTVGPGTYTVTVGAGGTGSTNYTGNGRGNSTSGGDSSCATLGARGGGYGSSYPNLAVTAAAGGSGGSGGGGAKFDHNSAGPAGTAQQPGSASGGFGNNGGTAVNGGGGGGGGAGGAGTAGISNVGGSGGAGVANGISGAAGTYGAGGGGAGAVTGGTGGSTGGGAGGNTVQNGANGTANTGGGGGGGGTGSLDGTGGGAGGSGIVIVRYPL
jgi:hypothetical protein